MFICWKRVDISMGGGYMLYYARDTIEYGERTRELLVTL